MATALITGSNRGLGLATAEALADRGHRVIVTARDLGAARDTAAALVGRGLDARALRLDVTSTATIEAAVAEVRAHEGGLDILVNNAGILPEVTAAGPPGAASLDLVKATYATNVFGPVAVTEAFLPLLRRSPAGRIVNVSSTMGSLTAQADPASPYYRMVAPGYQSAKAALNSLTISMAKLLADTDIKVTAVCPGYVRTGLTPLNRQQAPLAATEAAGVIVAAATLPADAPSGTFVDRDGPVPW